jgi:hypothetical protein
VPKISHDLVAPCGLYCGACPVHTAVIADLARDLRKALKQSRMDDLVKKVPIPGCEQYEGCVLTLETLATMRCKKPCQCGGGPKECPIKICSKKKHLKGCWECSDIKDCDTLKFLEPVHGDMKKRLRKIRKIGLDGFLAGNPRW